MRKLIIANMIYNAAFVAMGLSEMLGITSVHPNLPASVKWIWLIALAGGNLGIHLLMLRRETTR